MLISTYKLYSMDWDGFEKTIRCMWEVLSAPLEWGWVAQMTLLLKTFPDRQVEKKHWKFIGKL